MNDLWIVLAVCFTFGAGYWLGRIEGEAKRAEREFKGWIDAGCPDPDIQPTQPWPKGTTVGEAAQAATHRTQHRPAPPAPEKLH